MTPKEKADELINKMFKPNNHYLNENIEVDRDIAISSALICVREIIEFGNQQGIREPMMYWQSVKQEIKKL